ncbi:MAG TPA: hypothetical protein VGQ11_01145 [Candidatus Acidoferrales bacterium]|nr:hypothetical protein [Candidatus Acidoferrales bacterium]
MMRSKFVWSILVVALGMALALPAVAKEQSWNNVALIDTMCLNKVKADPDKHPKSCLLQCAGSGFGILTADGQYLKLDDEGNKKAATALKESKKTDHIRATVTGDLDGDTIKVKTLTLN